MLGIAESLQALDSNVLPVRDLLVCNGVLDAHIDWEFRRHLLKFYREEVVLQVANPSERHNPASNTGSESVGMNAALSLTKCCT